MGYDTCTATNPDESGTMLLLVLSHGSRNERKVAADSDAVLYPAPHIAQGIMANVASKQQPRIEIRA